MKVETSMQARPTKQTFVDTEDITLEIKGKMPKLPIMDGIKQILSLKFYIFKNKLYMLLVHENAEKSCKKNKLI